tara:strand:+ start:1095 stop:1694 length:600 start_codon:yes stop_codon:yes gene_type:complete
MDLYIFDFDDTLAITDSRVRVIRNGKELTMTSREFAKFDYNPGTDELDFGDFSRAQGTLIKDTVETMVDMMNKGEDVYIVTARSIADPVREWLSTEIQKVPPIVATSGSSGKRPWLINHLSKNNYERVVVYEDCTHNIRDLKEAVEEHNANTGGSVQYSAMCILPNQSIQQVENRWRPESLITEWDFREITKNFLRKTW